ncbi:hypothetical protein HB364_32700 [Pseudoflavitalea sp. X16]|uniref:hypothetical protein n=1 Tax=Paraflavitalea devenefica TaxID=2716334 RepID=UPI001420ADA4|nr:hypothetical protein [Paraflavitalea devenefica]NII29884.1 hypothetical protein [Paraflavitalea devenefica]
MTSIQHLTRNQVDTTKWDQCVQAAPNGLSSPQSLIFPAESPEGDSAEKVRGRCGLKLKS